MKKRILTAAFAVSAIVSASAQNLNPTVEISNVFEGKLVESDKPSIRMAVPDSLLRFDLEYDYSVFNTKYSGGYDFSPYLMDMRPEADSYRGRRFYLKAGAGYTLNPVFDLVYSPVNKGKFKVDLYASNNSYIGNYRNIGAARDNASDDFLTLGGTTIDGKDRTWGHDISSKAGVNVRYDWSKGMAAIGAGWRGINGNNIWGKSNFNAADIDARVASTVTGDRYFFYDAALHYRYGIDDVLASGQTGYGGVKYNEVGLKATLGPVLGRNRFLIDYLMDYSGYDNISAGEEVLFSAVSNVLVPKYVMKRPWGGVSLGVRISSIIRGNDENMPEAVLPIQQDGSKFYFHPDIHASVMLVPGYLDMYADITGGVGINSYSEMKERYHFYNLAYGRGAAAVMDNSVTKLDASLGFRGNIASRFRFDLKAGYSVSGNRLMETACSEYLADGVPVGLMPGIGYADMSLLSVDLMTGYSWKSVFADANLRLRKSWTGDEPVAGYLPALFAGTVRAGYDYNGRIRGWVYGDFSTSRQGCISYIPDMTLYDSRIPGFLDLGLHAEYLTMKNFSVFADFGNILNRKIQRTPLVAENGFNFTVGIIFSLR